MIKQLLITEDGSSTIAIPEMHVTYRSTHGAVMESNHVFIEAGLKRLILQKEIIHIFEMGFGTGLNTLLTIEHALFYRQNINYQTIEINPLSLNEIAELNYSQKSFLPIHECPWDKEVVINEYFTFHKIHGSLLNYSANKSFHLIYFDAFDPNTQPELWTVTVFEKMYKMLATNGVLVTYSSKGTVRRAMKKVGFIVDKIPGPPGKREMIRAIKC
jgi:tRNA U34 5-methylaminomethyl-2-thiouridine-forming methyltransferase MnmC